MLPEGFIAQIAQNPQFAGLCEALLTQPEVSVRVNLDKDGAVPEGAERVPWCDEGYYLSERPAFTFDPAMHQGRYYVQDASSMALAAVVRQLAADARPVRYLDVCAAPGGKTTTAAAALPAGSAIVANEYDFRRCEILAENVAKWGNPNTLVVRGDTARLRKMTGEFDIITVDAPCSGEGMMRKDPQAVAQWTPALVDRCAALQAEILDNAWTALRPGGYLVFSTCTFNPTENEGNLTRLIDEYGAIPVEINALADIDGIVLGNGVASPCYHFLPGRVRGEGLFIAVVQKPGDGQCSKVKTPKTQVHPWLSGNWVLKNIGDEVYAVPETTADFLLHASERLGGVVSVGVHVGTQRGRDLVPATELALSTALRREAFPQAEVDYPTAIAYLRRENIILPDGTPKGFVLITYDDWPIGFVKNLGNRSNNLYPKQWRIISSLHS